MPLSLEIKNYRSIGHARIELRPGLNILVGPNGSGKTCLLSSLKFIRDIFKVGAAQALARQGGSLRVYRHGVTEMSFSISESYGRRTYRRRKIPCQLYWEIRLAQAGEEGIATILHETFEIRGQHNDKQVRLFSVHISRGISQKAQIKQYICEPSSFGRDLFSLWNREFGDKNKKQLADLFGAKGTRREFVPIQNEPDRSCFPALAQYDEKITTIQSLFLFLNEYNITPDVARSSTEQLPFARMLPNGAAVSEVVDALENKRYQKLEQAHFMEMGDMYGDHDSYAYRRHFLFWPYEYRS